MKSICMLLQNQYDVDMRVRRKAEALVAAGYSVDVLALRGAKAQKTYMLEGIRVYTLALGKKRGSWPGMHLSTWLSFYGLSCG